MDAREQILTAFNFRHACKEFDPGRKIPEEDFNIILEAGRLSPSSFGFEPWRFIVIQNMELREKLRVLSWGAQKQLPTASHFVVLLARSGPDMRYDSEYLKMTMTDLQKSPSDMIKTRLERVKNFQEKDFLLIENRTLFDWACNQTYIALGNMMTAAALLGIDSCPIEGFNRGQLEKILENEKVLDKKHFGVACMVAFGYRVLLPKKQKTRRTVDEVIKWIK